MPCGCLGGNRVTVEQAAHLVLCAWHRTVAALGEFFRVRGFLVLHLGRQAFGEEFEIGDTVREVTAIKVAISSSSRLRSSSWPTLSSRT